MAASFATACRDSPPAGGLCLPSVIPILSAAWASLPKARAGCGNPACPDPWRGLCANMIPTPTWAGGESQYMTGYQKTECSISLTGSVAGATCGEAFNLAMVGWGGPYGVVVCTPHTRKTGDS